MPSPELVTLRLVLHPLPADAAAALPADRALAARRIGARLASDWPLADLLDVLPLQAAAAPAEEPFGVWLIVERATRSVVGDIGFMGPPAADGALEVGYSVVPDRRGRGYAGEALVALAAWALAQPAVTRVVAACDPANAPSIRTLERAGFRRSGTNGDGLLGWRLDA